MAHVITRTFTKDRDTKPSSVTTEEHDDLRDAVNSLETFMVKWACDIHAVRGRGQNTWELLLADGIIRITLKRHIGNGWVQIKGLNK